MATSKRRPRAQRSSAALRDTRPSPLDASRPPRWRPTAVCSMPKRSQSSSVCAKSRAVTSTSCPSPRMISISGRITSTCGLLVRSTQMRTSGPLPYLAVVLASITDPIVEVAVDVVDAMGLPGVFILMLLESACIPVPSEATMLFAGFNVSRGEYSLFAATMVGSVANLVGSWIAYWIGYIGRVDILEKHGKKLHIKQSHLQWADRWFERHGDATVFFTRMLPIIRTFISLPAGVARMPFWRFSLLSFLGCVPWVFMLTWIGKQAGDNWESWKDSLHYVDYAVAAAIVIGVIYLLVRRRSNGKGEQEPPARAEPERA